jgi:hypothetical protein
MKNNYQFLFSLLIVSIVFLMSGCKENNEKSKITNSKRIISEDGLTLNIENVLKIVTNGKEWAFSSYKIQQLLALLNQLITIPLSTLRMEEF